MTTLFIRPPASATGEADAMEQPTVSYIAGRGDSFT